MNILFTNKEKPPVIADPVAHAVARYGTDFTIRRSYEAWEKEASYYTTGAFASVGDGFVRHCGPTAITNLIATFRKRGRLPNDTEVTGEEIFRDVASIGKEKKFYWNTDVFRLYGGTFNMAVAAYLRAALKSAGAPAVHVRGPYPLTAAFARTSLQKGKLLYLELMWHPTYGNHHVLCYGGRDLISADGTRECLYLLTADGWNKGPRYLAMGDLRLSRYLEVS